ncbi:hypothetical protein HYW83_03080 [Candidatus Peregrinibacteria bacterium]|nr:hypothetical protein [Candidatus Peregrinibacteria bacterium]
MAREDKHEKPKGLEAPPLNSLVYRSRRNDENRSLPFYLRLEKTSLLFPKNWISYARIIRMNLKIFTENIRHYRLPLEKPAKLLIF